MIQTPPTPYRLPWIKTPINVNTLKSCLYQDLTNLLYTTEDLVNPIAYRITQNKRHYPHIALHYSEIPNSVKTKSHCMTQTPPTPYCLPWINTPNKPIGKFKYQSFYDAALNDRVLAFQIFFHFFKTNTKLFIRNTALSASMQDQSTNT